MNFTFVDEFVKFDIHASNSDIYIQFVRSPNAPIHFFDDAEYQGSLHFSDFRKAGYQFSKKDLSNLIYSVEEFDDIIDYKELFAEYNSTSILLCNKRKGLREVYIYGSQKMDFDSAKKIHAFRYICNNLQRMSVAETKIAYFIPKNFQDEKVTCIWDEKDIPNYDMVIDCCLTKGELFRIIQKYHQVKVIPSYVFFLEYCMNDFWKDIKRNNLHLIVVNMPTPEEFDLNDDETKALDYRGDIVGAMQRFDYIKRVFRKKSEYRYITTLGDKIYGSYSIKTTSRYRFVQASNFSISKVKNGVRNYKADIFKNSVSIYGPCIAYGLFSSDEETICANLRRILYKKQLKLNVRNFGVPDGSDLLNDLERMLATPYKQGDVIVWINCFEKELLSLLGNSVSVINVKQLMDGEHYWFLNHTMHCSYIANRKIAFEIFEHLNTHDCMTEPQNVKLKNPFFDFKLDYIKEELSIFKNRLSRLKVNSKNNGAIVMNCNPFTNGHKYLVEKAREQVDILFVFIVENNSRAIPFYYRYNMAKNACKEWKNVVIIGTGDYYASENTFSAYFNENNNAVDPSEDILLFAQVIARELNIKKRFLGTEPNNIVTLQLNKECKRVLPGYGIEVLEFKRLESEGRPISAATIREKKRVNQLEDVKKMIPQYTFNLMSSVEL